MSKPLPKLIPIAPHTVEPYDGHDRMVMCSTCKRGAVPDHMGRGGCIRYVPSMKHVPQHCGRFVGGAR